jgi:hypothetical protein
LKDSQVADFGADLLDGLDARCSCADDGNLLAPKLNAFLWVDSYSTLINAQ